MTDRTTGKDDWRNDPESDERWIAGNEYALTRLCAVVGVDPKDVSWDGSDGSLEEEADALIWRILTDEDGNLRPALAQNAK